MASERLQRAEDLTAPPVVGRYYFVRCIELGGRWWPVIGAVHADPEIGASYNHLHYDTRFLNKKQLEANRKVGEGGMYRAGSTVITGDAAAMAIVHIVQNNTLTPGEPGEQRYRRLRCVRAQLTFPAELPPVEALEAIYKKSWVKKDCRTCPHRGFPLASMPVDAEGGIVCPGHGLRWNATTGHLMPRGVQRQRLTVAPEVKS